MNCEFEVKMFLVYWMVLATFRHYNLFYFLTIPYEICPFLEGYVLKKKHKYNTGYHYFRHNAYYLIFMFIKGAKAMINCPSFCLLLWDKSA